MSKTEHQELDELKSLWQGLHAAQQPQQLDATSIHQMLQQRTQGPLSRIQRSVRFEMWFTYICTATLLVLPIVEPARYLNIFYALVVLFMLACCYLYYRSHKKLCAFNYGQANAKQALTNLVNRIQGLVHKYYLITQLTIAPSAVFGLFWGMHTAAQEDGRTLADVLQKPLVWVLLLLSLALISIPGYFFVRWYFRTLYGQYLDQLKQSLRELDE